MTKNLSVEYVDTQSVFVGDKLAKFLLAPENDAIWFPKPSKLEMEEWDAGPDNLRDAGEDVPEDDEDAVEYAQDAFMGSDAYYEWQERHSPQTNYLYPCEIEEGADAIVQALYDAGVSCTYVKTEHEGQSYEGFMVTGNGMDMSDHVCMAYIEAGCVPPYFLIDRGISNTRRDEWHAPILDAADQMASFMAHRAERLADLVSNERGSGPRP